MILSRLLDLNDLIQKKSFFLFGPRATGKTFLIRHSLDLKKTLNINLLHSEFYLALSKSPQLLREIVLQKVDCTCVVIDEIQRIPELLNEVHALIEEYHITFLLTGSSARTLKRAGVNLLAGRAWEANLHPLVWKEQPYFDLNRHLLYGGLPSVYLSKEPHEELYAYIHTYLNEEIQAESFLRKVAAFSNFLQVAALSSGQMLNFSALASDTGIPASSIREYYHILEDTFLGFFVPGWTKTVKRKAIARAKFYFFDLGVKNTLAGIRTIDPKSDLYGQAFEHFMALELRAYLSYRRIKKTLCYWCSVHGMEVDFIIGDEYALEIKSTQTVQAKHLKNLLGLAEENICSHYFLISCDPISRRSGPIQIFYWQEFLELLWSDQLIH